MNIATTVEPVEELDFAKDPADALLILLNITHFRFDIVPNTVLEALLSDIAVLCDQYDCAHLVKPWIPQWLGRESSMRWEDAKSAFKGANCEKWLFISWVFGRERIFKELSSLLVREMRTCGEGSCKALEGHYGPMPPGIIESILRTRAATIKRLFQIPRKCVERFTNNSSILCKHESMVCDALTYGSLLRNLQIDKLDLSMAINAFHTPIVDLAQKLANLTVHVYVNNDGFGVQDHRKCFTTDFKEEVGAIMATIEDPVLEFHICHMVAQQAKLKLL